MKNKTTTALLAFFLGGLGVHRFYLGQIILGIFFLIFSWTLIPTFIGFIDFIIFLAMSKEKFDWKYNSKQPKKHSQESLNVSSENHIAAIPSTYSDNKNEISIHPNQENIANLIKEEYNQREKKIESFNYTPIIIQRKGLQLLESLSILNTTKNLDTLIGRFNFIEEMYDDFIIASYNHRYISDIQVSLDQYKSIYYDRIINDFELSLIINPNIENLKIYYSQCLFNSFNSFYNEQMEQIKQLKRHNAILRRKEKILKIGNETIIEYNKLNINKNKLELQQLKEKLSLINPTIESKNELQITTRINNLTTINPNSSFELNIYNTTTDIIKKVVSILIDDKIWNKSRELIPLFALHNIKCKEVDDYIQKYKPYYLKFTQELIDKSQEYKNASEKDKEIIIKEFKQYALNKLPERAYCDLITLFDYSNIECSIDDKLIQKYGYDTISKYFGLSHHIGKVITHWERKDFDDLIKADLVYTADEIDQIEILKSQTLKILNQICDKEEKFFKRKNKAIEYLQENQELFKNIGKYIATRNLFKLKPLPNEFQDINVTQIQNHWMFLKEYTSLIIDTYLSSEQNHMEIKEDKSWIEYYKIEIHEDYNPNYICQRAREESKTYTKSNLPKLPFHVGCNCRMRAKS